MPNVDQIQKLELVIPEEMLDQQANQTDTEDKGDKEVTVIPLPEQNALPELEPERVPSVTNLVKPEFSQLARRFGKFFIFAVVVGILFYGRFSVPDNDVPCIVDKIMNGLKVPNDFINTPGRESYRRGFQILGSLLIDLVFLFTFGYWIFKGNSLRFPLTLGAFYVIRVFVQLFWQSPFPEGFYWDDPGFPSLVVPYGRGSDFYYSGHSGFVMICLREQWKSNNKKISILMGVILIECIFTLMIYRIHYSIDIFTGVFFADYCFYRVDQLCKALIDPLCYKIMLKLKKIIKRKKPQAVSSS